MKRVAITGGAGHIATQLRRFVTAEVEHVRLIDLKTPAGLLANESFVEADLADPDAVRYALQGMDSIVHLGGIATEAAIGDIVRSNVLGTHNLYEAAKATGISRVVFASSNHATGFYPRTETITPLDPPRPDSRYGLSKCWGELVAGLYYDTVGIRTLSIRIGNAAVYPASERSAAIWISARDLWQLVKIGLTHAEIAAAVVYGMSRVDSGWWKDEIAEYLGYRPEDTAREHLRMEQQDDTAVASFYQGGSFCAPDHDGKIRLRDRRGLILQPGASL